MHTNLNLKDENGTKIEEDKEIIKLHNFNDIEEWNMCKESKIEGCCFFVCQKEKNKEQEIKTK
jgi:hypothetical protein